MPSRHKYLLGNYTSHRFGEYTDGELHMAKSARRKRMELADPVTFAAMEAAQQAGEQRYGARMQAVEGELRAFLLGRKPPFAGSDAVTFMALKARFDAVAIEQKHFVEADLAFRLDPRRDGSEDGRRIGRGRSTHGRTFPVVGRREQKH